MAIPKFDEFFPPIMEVIADGKEHSLKNIREYCVKYFNLSESDLKERLVSGRSTLFFNRVGWARTYLKNAGLLSAPSRGILLITPDGKKALDDGVKNITLEYLEKYEAFRKYKYGETDKKVNNGTNEIPSSHTKLLEENPQEKIESALKQIHENLAEDLMAEVLKMDCYDFENLIIKLLIKMGYGTLEQNLECTTKKSGDEGIDGIVSADRFGFDSIYTQAKLWKESSSIGRPEIQKFLGALAGQGAEKGIFITTASFSPQARAFADKQLKQKIVLVDGKELMNLMIEYNLGVSVENTYEVKKLDYDFFNE